MEPYWSDGPIALYHGDCREVLPALGRWARCVVADPPYGETALPWDKWQDGWLEVAAKTARALWCFGSLRMYLGHVRQFEGAGWRLSQDVIWEKPIGTSFATDRFARVHEQPTHWYRGEWRNVYHQPPREDHHGQRLGTRVRGPEESLHGQIGRDTPWVDDGRRIARSVMHVAGARRGPKAPLHPTEKPLGILGPLITYVSPPGGLIVDPFAGSGSTLDAARASGRQAIGVEISERYCEIAAKRLSQADLFSGEAS